MYWKKQKNQIRNNIKMNNKIVTVLTPNGRRQNIKLEPNSIIMQVCLLLLLVKITINSK